MTGWRRSGLLLASTNPAKLRRLRGLFAHSSIRLLTPQEIGVRLHVPEIGQTHEENAALKAVAWSRASGTYAIASDGGLLIPALGQRWNSLQTQRFAGPDADDYDRAQALLRLMEGLESGSRRAWWHEAIALALRGELLAGWAVQSDEGMIATSFDHGGMEQGFWVASLWYFPSIGKTYRQATESELAVVGDPWSRLRAIVVPAVERRLKSA